MKSKLIIIEGPQGCGKTTLANYLRENIAGSNLYRLTGNKDKTLTGKEKSKNMYLALMEYIKKLENCDINLIFDRTFFTDYVYSLLGYKEYTYEDVYNNLLDLFGNLNFDIYYISLYLENPNIYKERLKRVHHNYQAFSKENSLKQQETYKLIIPQIKELKNTKVYEIAMDDFNLAYKQINDIFDIHNSMYQE